MWSFHAEKTPHFHTFRAVDGPIDPAPTADLSMRLPTPVAWDLIPLLDGWLRLYNPQDVGRAAESCWTTMVNDSVNDSEWPWLVLLHGRLSAILSHCSWATHQQKSRATVWDVQLWLSNTAHLMESHHLFDDRWRWNTPEDTLQSRCQSSWLYLPSYHQPQPLIVHRWICSDASHACFTNDCKNWQNRPEMMSEHMSECSESVGECPSECMTGFLSQSVLEFISE